MSSISAGVFYQAHMMPKLLKKALKEPNWHLMISGATYRLGIFENRLHGYD